MSQNDAIIVGKRYFSEVTKHADALSNAVAKATAAGYEVDIEFSREGDDPPVFGVEMRRIVGRKECGGKP